MAVKEEALKCGVHFSPDEIMIDFEVALVQSLEFEFPGAHIHGCYFNFSQCLWMKHGLMATLNHTCGTTTDTVAQGRTTIWKGGTTA